MLDEIDTSSATFPKNSPLASSAFLPSEKITIPKEAFFTPAPKELDPKRILALSANTINWLLSDLKTKSPEISKISSKEAKNP